MKNLKQKLNKQGGFTLIEMLIVVAIIAILIAIAIPLVNKALESAREATDSANERAAYGIAMAEVISENTLAGESVGVDPISAYYKIDPSNARQGSLVKVGEKPTSITTGGCYGKGTALGSNTTPHANQTIKITYTPNAATEAAQWTISWE